MPDYSACPFCGGEEAEKVTRTWWGGVIGPKALTHVKCRACRKTFNGRTGKSNTGIIVTYLIVTLALAVAIFFALAPSD